MKLLRNKKEKLKIVFFTVGILIIIVCLAKTFHIKFPLAFIYSQNSEQKNSEFIQGFRMAKKINKDDVITEDMLEAVTCSSKEVPAQLQDILNSKVRMNLSKGVLLTNTHLRSKQKLTDDMRIHNFPYIRLTNHMKKGDYIDVRIAFANGGDFVLLSKKKIEDISFMDAEGTKGNSLWLKVAEEELLRLSSAVVDAYLNDGCKIYAIQYVSETQKDAIVNYTVSSMIKQLMKDDPNIAEKAGNIMEWSLWEEYKTGNSQQSIQSDLDSGHNIEEKAEAYPIEPSETDMVYMD